MQLSRSSSLNIFSSLRALGVWSLVLLLGISVAEAKPGGKRGGKVIQLKKTTDDAIAKGCPSIEKVVVFNRTNTNINAPHCT